MQSESQAVSRTGSVRLSRRNAVKGAAAAAVAVPLGAMAGRVGPFGSHAQFLAMAQAAPIQFDLVPSGIKDLFPSATATVYITPGDTADDVQVVAQNMPPNLTFTCYFLQSPTKPFGFAQYCMDLKTDSYGYGTTSFHGITQQAYAMVAESAGVSDDQSGSASGTQLEHFGMWFSSLDDAITVLNNPALTGTPFDGGTPPAHAGPQAMNDGSPDPKF
ncbi:MAG: twin-arginine translocation signal domain-containing protein [Dehalococcoidia bacterium]